MMKVPDRWLDYKAIGNVVANTSFVAFKVPLHKNLCRQLPPPERHTTCDVVNHLPELGLVINLTNTDNDSKYYSPKDWEQFGVEYKWIKTEGHKTPSQSLLIDFCRTVKKFLMRNPEKLIGVHCTHGLNRTGYFVCSYIVLCNNVTPSDAMRNFAVARGHQIERPNYISAIQKNRQDEELKRKVLSLGRSRWSNSTNNDTQTTENVETRSNSNDNSQPRSAYREWQRSRMQRNDRN